MIFFCKLTIFERYVIRFLGIDPLSSSHSKPCGLLATPSPFANFILKNNISKLSICTF